MPGNGVRADWSGHQSGSWSVVDDGAALLWLPRTLRAFENVGTTVTLNNRGQPATLTETGSQQDPDPNQENGLASVNYTCHSPVVYNPGAATVDADLAPTGRHRGYIGIGTSYLGVNGRGFTTSLGAEQFTCSPPGTIHARFGYPAASNELIGYAAKVPFSSVGRSRFTVTAKDVSGIRTAAPCTSEPDMHCTGPAFHISGSYTLKKRCDGVLHYSGRALRVTGTCQRPKRAPGHR
jgi:hypothetical protein